jgi:TRAP-type C4-dicarboxylate transport system permease small subunit
MNRFERYANKLIITGVVIGGSFLTGMLLLIVANVIYRFTGSVIAGTYESVELMAVVVVIFALVYSATEKSDVVIDILVHRLSQRARLILSTITLFLTLGTWAIITWASMGVLVENWLNEKTSMLSIPYLPFRFVWVFGLSLLCLVILIILIKTIYRSRGKGAVDKWIPLP